MQHHGLLQKERRLHSESRQKMHSPLLSIMKLFIKFYTVQYCQHVFCLETALLGSNTKARFKIGEAGMVVVAET